MKGKHINKKNQSGLIAKIESSSEINRLLGAIQKWKANPKDEYLRREALSAKTQLRKILGE